MRYGRGWVGWKMQSKGDYMTEEQLKEVAKALQRLSLKWEEPIGLYVFYGYMKENEFDPKYMKDIKILADFIQEYDKNNLFKK